MIAKYGNKVPLDFAGMKVQSKAQKPLKPYWTLFLPKWKNPPGQRLAGGF